VLADRYHHRLLATPREVHRALRYVLLNARRHAVRDGTSRSSRPVPLDPASSAAWFDGWRRIPHVDAAKRAAAVERPPVAPPRFWLVTIGWRRHGLIDPADVPG
jgi:hypothetical protein